MVSAPLTAAPAGGQHIVHRPLLRHPWFAEQDEGVTLHRYLDDQFVPRFVQEAMAGRLTGSRAQEWYTSDRFGRQDLPTLRLPMHQAFYIVCCEVQCDRPGRPAYDPKRVVDAGFVVRRHPVSGGQQRWLLQDGQAQGWQGGGISEQEPDDYRRFLNHKLLTPQYPEPSYSGEECYPLHPLVVRDKEPKASRNHTLLWGYLPLGGSFRVKNNPAPAAEVSQALARELSWPFGERSARAWAEQDSRPALHGHASQAFSELIELLLIRYHIFDEKESDNRELQKQLAAIHFYPALTPHFPTPFDPYAVPVADSKAESLLAWLRSSRDALLEWLSNIASGLTTLANSPLPHTTAQGDGTTITINRADDLYLSEAQAGRLRDTLILRAGRAMVEQENGMSLPRFGQADDDSFFVVPFVRWRDHCGCERIHWGGRTSLRFRVVSPLDPEAQRPHTVVLPGLDDLRRGAARGLTMLAPKSLTDLLRKIKPSMEAGPGGPGNPSGLAWSFSLSLPAVTICAMVFLMILVNLLNLVFRWLPWAFQALPRLGGKASAAGKSS